MEAETTANKLTENKDSILLKCSLRNHTPEDIYDYISRNVGDLGMKIKKKQAIIGFQDRGFYDKVLSQHRSIILRGKRIQFKPFPKTDENYIESEQQQIVDFSKLSTQGNYPEFKATNRIQARLNLCRVQMMDKVQELFMPTVEVTRQRVDQLFIEFKEEGPRERQMLSLTSALEKKFKGLQSKYEQDVTKINKFIREFSMKPTTIDLEPTFNFQETWSFPKITEKNMRFQPANFFKNTIPCKRLCAINSKQFAVTTYEKNKGYVKIFDVNSSDPKEQIAIDGGAYGICRVNNFLLVGAYDKSIKYINLEDSDRSVDHSRALSDKLNCSFFYIKIFKKSADKPQILTLSTDYKLRKFEISFEEITAGLYTVSFDEKQCLNAEFCVTFDVINPQVVVYGAQKRIKKYHVQKNLTKQIPLSQGPLKIKKFNENLCAVGTVRNVEMVDLRTEMTVQTFPQIQQIKALEVIGEHSMMFGAKGIIGLLDDRMQQVFPWKSESCHKSIVYDILKLENRIISCDLDGKIYSWSLADQVSAAPGEGYFNLEFKKKL